MATETITAKEACFLVGYQWAVIGEKPVNGSDMRWVFGLYASKYAAVSACDHLNEKLHEPCYRVAKIAD